jgi:exodeoxyribonuclease-3
MQVLAIRVLAAVYNVVPTPLDIYPRRSLDNNALKLQSNGPLWAFWDYKRERWPNHKGMSLDDFLLSPQLSECLVDGGVDRWVCGEVNASDHAPVLIELDV